MLQPRDQFVSRLLKKLKLEDNQPQLKAEKTEEDKEAGETWEDLISDEDVSYLYYVTNRLQLDLYRKSQQKPEHFYKHVRVMAYLLCRIQIPIPILIRTASQMATLYYVELFTLHRVRLKFKS